MNKLNKDRAFAVGSMILALYLGYMSFSYPAESAFFPRVLSILLGLLSALLLTRLSLKTKSVRPDKTDEKNLSTTTDQIEIVTLKSAGLVFGSIILYGLLIMVINYEISTLLFLAGMMFLLGNKNPFTLTGISIGLMILLYGIFFRLLGVGRPESLLFH